MATLNPHVEIHKEVKLRDPILVAAFKGWNDAGESATHAAHHLLRVWEAEKIASIDPEEFYDFQQERPHVKLHSGFAREIIWPANEFWAAKLEGQHDVLILVGVEPTVRWRTFAAAVVDVVQSLDVKLAITLGALLADVPHTRPVHITGTAGSPELVEELGLERSQYEGPTGIVGVLHDALRRAEIQTASLWAAVPHYLAVTPNPKAALALVERTVQLTKIAADIGELQHATAIYEHRADEIVSTDEDVQGYVHLLEEREDEGPDSEREEVSLEEIPSAEEIGAELERFLRENDQ